MDYKKLYNLDLEQTVLGAMLLNKDCAENGLEVLLLEDFFEEDLENRLIFKAMKNLFDEGLTIDVTSLVSQLTKDKTLDKINDEYIGKIMDKVSLFSDFDDYVKQLKDFTLLRKLVKECNLLINEATTKEIPSVREFLGKAEKNINEITNARSVSKFKSAREVGSYVSNQILNNYGGSQISGLETGFKNLDQMTDGFGKGQLIVLAARPGVGKSALALNMSYNITRREENVVAYFSLEMSNEELMRRLISLVGGFEQKKLNSGYLNKDERMKLTQVQSEIAKLKLYFEESTVVSIDDIVIKCKKLKEQMPGLSLVVIDHIGIIQEGSKKFSSDQEKIQFFARRLKALALELDIPLLVVCHINREADKNKNKGRSRIPELSELRGSGEIENSADKVLLLYRESYYKSQGIDVSNKKGFGDDLEDDTNMFKNEDLNRGQKVDIIVAKNRQGPNGKIPLYFFLSTGRFSAPSDEATASYEGYYNQ